MIQYKIKLQIKPYIIELKIFVLGPDIGFILHPGGIPRNAKTPNSDIQLIIDRYKEAKELAKYEEKK